MKKKKKKKGDVCKVCGNDYFRSEPWNQEKICMKQGCWAVHDMDGNLQK